MPDVPPQLTISGEAARELGVNVKTIRDLIRTNEIPTYRLPHTPNAKGIDPDGMAKLRRLLNADEPARASA